MNPLKVLRATVLLGLLALAAFAPIASATVLTSPAGTAFTGTKISHATGQVRLFAPCETSTIHEEVESHGAAVTAVSKVNSMTFSGCTNTTITVLKPGTMEVHSLGNGNGTVTWSGFEVKVSRLGIDCIFTVMKGDVGTLTGSKNTGGTAVLDVNAFLGRTGGSFVCGSTTEWVGTYVVEAPDYLDVD